MGKIYDKSINEIMIDYFGKLSPADIFSTQEMLQYFNDNYPLIKKGSVLGHLILFSTNAKSRINHSRHNNGKCDLLFKINKNQYRLFDKLKDPHPTYLENIGELTEGGQKEDDDNPHFENTQEFAYEKDLQNYLVKNLQAIESGLQLFEDDDVTGIEYPADGRSIDILAVDKNNDFVVFELKVSKGYDRVIGQLLYYISWVEKNMATENQKVRGIIICKEISDDLLLACSKLKDVELFEYELSFKVKRRLSDES